MIQSFLIALRVELFANSKYINLRLVCLLKDKNGNSGEKFTVKILSTGHILLIC